MKLWFPPHREGQSVDVTLDQRQLSVGALACAKVHLHSVSEPPWFLAFA